MMKLHKMTTRVRHGAEESAAPEGNTMGRFNLYCSDFVSDV